MLLRNSLLLAILSWPALVSNLVPMVLMVSASIFFACRSFKINDGLRLYLGGSGHCFRCGQLGVYQTLLAKLDDTGAAGLLRTRVG